jgi:hypothetical protein
MFTSDSLFTSSLKKTLNSDSSKAIHL